LVLRSGVSVPDLPWVLNERIIAKALIDCIGTYMSASIYKSVLSNAFRVRHMFPGESQANRTSLLLFRPG
jgi:hypothetical protein